MWGGVVSRPLRTGHPCTWEESLVRLAPRSNASNANEGQQRRQVGLSALSIAHASIHSQYLAKLPDRRRQLSNMPTPMSTKQ
jgi:hypothetical protein